MSLTDIISKTAQNPMARDTELLNYYDDSDLIEPILFFYTWSKPAITIGKIQKDKNIIIDEAHRLGLSYYTRPTGGRAVLHGWDICYTFIAPQNHSVFGGPLKQSFRTTNEYITKIVNETLNASIMSAEFNSPNPSLDCFSEIITGEGIIQTKNFSNKIIGSAQALARRSFIQQGSIQINKPEIESENFSKINNFSEITGTVFDLEFTCQNLNQNAKIINCSF
jgi:lipoate-protein ligase A